MSTSKSSLTVSASDDALLRSIHFHHYLTAEQVCRLFYSKGSLVYARVRLKRLFDAGYLTRLRLPNTKTGNVPWIYTLGRKGIQYLTAAGYTDFLKFRPSEQQEKSWLFLSHTGLINDILIAVQILPRLEPSITLAAMHHEWMFKGKALSVSIGKDETIRVIPDGFFELHIQGKQRAPVILEADRATEEQAAFKRKIRGLLVFVAQGHYEDLFGVAWKDQILPITIAIVTTGGGKRLDAMQTWIEQVLTEEGKQQFANLFLLTGLPTGEIDPRAVFLTPVWQQPFGTAQTAFVEL